MVAKKEDYTDKEGKKGKGRMGCGAGIIPGSILGFISLRARGRSSSDCVTSNHATIPADLHLVS